MIFGIGSDIVEFARVEAAWSRFGDRFARRILTPGEYALFAQARDKPRFLARRFAAKEALSKALGTGFTQGVSARGLGILADAWGKPQVALEPHVRDIASRLGAGRGFITLTDEHDLVVAFAVFEVIGAAA